MMKYGLVVIATGFFMYIVGTIFFNYNLRKNKNDLLEDYSRFHENTQENKLKNRKVSNKLVITSTSLPGWVGLMLLPSIPLIVIGIIMVLLSLTIDLFK